MLTWGAVASQTFTVLSYDAEYTLEFGVANKQLTTLECAGLIVATLAMLSSIDFAASAKSAFAFSSAASAVLAFPLLLLLLLLLFSFRKLPELSVVSLSPPRTRCDGD